MGHEALGPQPTTEPRNPGPRPEHRLDLHVTKPLGNGPARVGSSRKASHTPGSLGTLGKASSQHFSAGTGESCVLPAPCPSLTG